MHLHQQDTDYDGTSAPTRRTDYGRKQLSAAVVRVLKYRTVIGSCELAHGAQIEKLPDLYVSVPEAIYLERQGANNVEIHLLVTPEDECTLAWDRFQARKRWQEDHRSDGWTRPSEKLYRDREEQEARKAAWEKERLAKEATTALTRAVKRPEDAPEDWERPENSVLHLPGVGDLLAQLGAEDAAKRRAA